MPLPTISQGMGAAANDLGLGSMLQGQVKDETEEQRKKRMAEMAQQRAVGPAGSMAVTSLFGPGGMGSGPGY